MIKREKGVWGLDLPSQFLVLLRRRTETSLVGNSEWVRFVSKSENSHVDTVFNSIDDGCNFWSDMLCSTPTSLDFSSWRLPYRDEVAADVLRWRERTGKYIYICVCVCVG